MKKIQAFFALKEIKWIGWNMVFMVKDFIFLNWIFLIGKLLKNIKRQWGHDEFDGILDYRTYNKLLKM